MQKTGMLALAFLAFPTWAGADTARCGISHHVRVGGTEMRASAISFRNGDPVNAATIERITIYDFHGRVVHDSVANAHPINTDLPGGVNITVVPPHANYYLRTNHFWGNNPIPDLGDGIDGNSRGFSMTAVVEYSKPGNPKLFEVSRSVRARDRFFDPNTGQASEGAERAYDLHSCS
ncbi:MAG: hypothetical protein OEW90_04455 [Betaproteobacteria bacterium]|nr:hypothetical protein [Betaproteobacteria bacterium]